MARGKRADALRDIEKKKMGISIYDEHNDNH
ncbi:hypothetical protein NITGR_310039 [Nitrospina gracilis 3/211]|uniref:Uncharacterized protein n=1 Tax=Nitrospina gracilis (strain 3/211) TaxID=1266370 RepID=M1YXZ1_NITG3|nr:hypothetical protein NITGR_310039 [Nitrospina gracilis 3/211]